VRPRSKKIIHIVLAGLFPAAGLWTANLCAYQYFAADFPADPNRHWHAAWGNRFFFLALLFFAGFSYSLWRVGKIKSAV
jgi:hypothetical protein